MEQREKRGVLRAMYDWVLRQSERRNAVWVLFFVGVVESIFFPVPPDALLVPMGLSRPKKAVFYAFVATVGSVIGGAVGYLIGYTLRGFAVTLLTNLGAGEYFHKVALWYRDYAAFAVAAAAFTPIPYKVFTLGAGICEVAFHSFILISLLFRGARFFIEGALLAKYGERARVFIEKHLLLIAVLCLALAAVIIWLAT